MKRFRNSKEVIRRNVRQLMWSRPRRRANSVSIREFILIASTEDKDPTAGSFPLSTAKSKISPISVQGLAHKTQSIESWDEYFNIFMHSSIHYLIIT